MTEPTTPEAPLNLQKRLADQASAPGNGVPADPLVDLALVDVTVEAGLELQARSQWSYARTRFLRHRQRPRD